MKKIMQINITCGKGSTGRLSVALYNASISAGFEARFAYSAYIPSLGKAFRIENKLQNYFRRGLNKYFGRRIKNSRPGTMRLIRYIEKEKPDLIHLHNVQQNSVDYPLFFEYLKKMQIPTVYTLHDCWSFTRGCYHFTKLGCTEYQTGCQKCFPDLDCDDIRISPSESYAIKSEKIGKNESIYPITVSNWLCKCASSSYMGQMKHPPQTIYNGIDVNVFTPKDGGAIRRKFAISDDQTVVLGVASFWESGKGLELFQDLYQLLDSSFVIVLIGTGSDLIRSGGNARIISIPKTENIHELASFYSAADVFVNASSEETFGLTTGEALSCGTPAVVFRSTACPEIIDEKTGIVVDEFTAEALAKAVRTIRVVGKEMYSSACTERIEKLFSETRMVNEYIKLYQTILGEDIAESEQ